MIEGTPSKSALFVNGKIGGYIPTNVRNSRYVPALISLLKENSGFVSVCVEPVKSLASFF